MAFFRNSKTDKKAGTVQDSDRTVMLTNDNMDDVKTGQLKPSVDATKQLDGFDGRTMQQPAPEPSSSGGSLFDTSLPLEDDFDEDDGGDGATVFVGGGQVASEVEEAVDEKHPKGETTGWLVVVEGPKKGESFPLRHGPQLIGRGAEYDVNLHDPAISRNKPAATVHYDPNMKQFSLYRGQATNNMYTRREGQMAPLHVGMNHILELGDEILFGDDLTTVLIFVPLCGQHFCWKELK